MLSGPELSEDQLPRSPEPHPSSLSSKEEDWREQYEKLEGRMNDENSYLHEVIVNLNNEILELKQTVGWLKEHPAENRLDQQLRADLEEKEGEVRRLEEQQQLAEIQLSTALHESSRVKQEFQHILHEKSEHLAEMEREMGRLRRSKQQYDEVLAKKEEEKRAELDGYQKHIEGLNEEISELKCETDSLNAEIAELKDKAAGLLEEKASVEEQMARLKKRYESAMEENDSLIRWRGEAESELTDSRKLRQQWEREATLNIDALQDENNVLREYARKAAEENSELKDMLRMAEDNDTSMTRQLEQSEAGKYALVKECEELRSKVDQYRQLCLQNESHIDNLLNERDYLAQKVESLSSKHPTNIANIANENEQLRGKLEATSAELE